jgi:hypothetical protein
MILQHGVCDLCALPEDSKPHLNRQDCKAAIKERERVLEDFYGPEIKLTKDILAKDASGGKK